MKIDKEVKVGLLATIAFTILYVGLAFLKGKNLLSNYNMYYAVYDNNEGINTSSTIIINGLSVGNVRSLQILPEKKYAVLVSFEIPKKIQLTDRTIAKIIHAGGLLEGKAIELVIQEGNLLPPHSTLLGQSDPTLHDIQAIPQLAKKVAANLVDNTDKINTIIRTLGEITKAVYQTLMVNEKEIASISKNMAQVSQELSNKEYGMGALLCTAKEFVESLRRIKIQPVAEKVTDILVHIDAVLREKQTGSLSKLLYEDDLYHNINATLVSLDQLLIDIKKHPKRYVHFSFFGNPSHTKNIK